MLHDSKALAQDDGAPGGGSSDEGSPAGTPPSITQYTARDTQIAPVGGGVTPPAAPGAGTGHGGAVPLQPVTPTASGQAASSTQVYTEAELNNRLAQQRAQFEKQIERMQLRVEAIATGVPGADVLLDRIDRKAITYDEASKKPTNLKELLETQRTALATALGFAAAAPEGTPATPTTPTIPTITPTNGAQPTSSIQFTKAAIEAMSPEQINANWPSIQAALKAGLIK